MMTASSKARSIPGRPTLGFVSDFIANILAGDDTLWKERCEGPNASTACRVDPRTLLSPLWGSPDSVAVSPGWGPIATSEEEDQMRFARRIAIALGSLVAIALAGGAHWKG